MASHERLKNLESLSYNNSRHEYGQIRSHTLYSELQTLIRLGRKSEKSYKYMKQLTKLGTPEAVAKAVQNVDSRTTGSHQSWFLTTSRSCMTPEDQGVS